MSTIAERARSEADETERELGDGDVHEDEPEPEAAPEPEPEAAQLVATEAQLKERAKKLDAEAKRHEAALQRIHGEGWALYGICPCCEGDGFLIPWPEGSMPEVQWQAVKALSGKIETVNLRVAPDVECCEACDGYGVVITGAKTENGVTKLCATCSGIGYTAKGTVYPNVIVPAPEEGIEAYGTGGPGAPKDEWGRTAGHPRYGIDPKYLGGQW